MCASKAAGEQMNGLLKAILIAAFLTPVAFAGESSDVSLANEVDQYLEQSSTDTWQEPSTMRAFFDGGLHFESNDGNFTMEIFGRIMWDSVWRSSDDFGANVTVFGRTPDRVREVAEAFGARAADWDQRLRRSGEVLINATSVGMWPVVEASPMPTQSLAGCRLVFDLVYNPLETKLLRDAKQAGAAALSGLDMFVRQAAVQFELWTGQSPDTSWARTMLTREIAARTAGDKR